MGWASGVTSAFASRLAFSYFGKPPFDKRGSDPGRIPLAVVLRSETCSNHMMRWDTAMFPYRECCVGAPNGWLCSFSLATMIGRVSLAVRISWHVYGACVRATKRKNVSINICICEAHEHDTTCSGRQVFRSTMLARPLLVVVGFYGGRHF